ncbi:MAG: hypothetical protein J6334_14225 [Kiritimatiellae bacterium]|nr:hypothetical protein [Kiritimatiellia bacterium]
MTSPIAQFISRVRASARRKPNAVTIQSMGRQRTFIGYDWGSDTFIFEKDVWRQLGAHNPILVVRKSDLIRGATGHIMTVTTGNHSVAAIPLLSGQFWNLGSPAPAKRGAILTEKFVCSNVVESHIEISQRDVPTALVNEVDEWLQGVGIPLDNIIMSERNDETLEFYRRQGQEWRIKPLAWTRKEMDFALRTSKNRINSILNYYHSAKGVHFLTYPEFHRLTQLTVEEFPKLEAALREMVSIFEGARRSFMRQPKFHGHHEIELFGVRRGVAEKGIVPELERLMEGITLKMISPSEAIDRIRSIDTMLFSSLDRPDFADEHSSEFVERLYMHLTGEIYYAHNDFGSRAFDDRRTPLPGATFRGGRPDFHPGADERTRILLANVEQMLSQNEIIEYANVYEVRNEKEDDDAVSLGSGGTREILFKTNRRPLCTSLIEKRLAQHRHGYGSYMLARVQGFKALGVGFCDYRLLMRQDRAIGKIVSYYIRNRCEGEPLGDIPGRIFRKSNNETGDDANAVFALGALLGSAAAQNLVLKKYLPDEGGCRFGVGKEVFEFGYDISLKREMPTHVSLCSVRGSLGWPDLSHTEENLKKMFTFYLTCYAKVLYGFWSEHAQAVSLTDLAVSFLDGFEQKTREMHWNYTVRREQFDAFDPELPADYSFVKKWQFALWALDQQAARIERLREWFLERIIQIKNQPSDKKTSSKSGTPST